MVNNSLDSIFAALSDPTRRGILSRLASGGECFVGELANPYPISAPAISKHLNVLEAAGLITRERRGRVRLCRLNSAPLVDAAAWIEVTRAFWEGQFDALDRHLKENPE